MHKPGRQGEDGEKRERPPNVPFKEELGRKQRQDGWGRAEACGQGFAYGGTQLIITHPPSGPKQKLGNTG